MEKILPWTSGDRHYKAAKIMTSPDEYDIKRDGGDTYEDDDPAYDTETTYPAPPYTAPPEYDEHGVRMDSEP